MTDKSIDTVVEDIYGLLEAGIEGKDEVFEKFGREVAEVLKARLRPSERQRKGTLRMSNLGTPCNRKLWYSVNQPEKAEPIEPHARLKFLYGDLVEELILLLAELSGHSVEGRQDEQEILGVKGHRDVVLDGVVTDVKSASTYSFKKFEEGRLREDDPFGYSDQIQQYLHAGQEDPLVTDKDRAAFLVVDKTLGHICLDVHKKQSFPIEKVVEYKIDLVSRPEPPARKYDLEPEGKSGNMKLSMPCSYCDHKRECHPGLRTFLYSHKPVHLAVVKKEPNVPEVAYGP